LNISYFPSKDERLVSNQVKYWTDNSLSVLFRQIFAQHLGYIYLMAPIMAFGLDKILDYVRVAREIIS